LEETGLHIEVTGLLDVERYTNDPRGPGVVIFYRARVVSGELHPADDADDVCLFGPDQLPDNIAFPSNHRILQAWRVGKGDGT